MGSIKQIARMVHRRLLELRLLGRWLIRLGSYTQGRTNEPLRSAAKKKRSCSPFWCWEMRFLIFSGHIQWDLPVLKGPKVINEKTPEKSYMNVGSEDLRGS